ncbi:hypothetical protein [Actinomadura sp. 9N407]|uniref:hypothetical protein n=1 Tax=Actinomadura sp. 9N407 TaxID=3375154 RepID=UPI0037B0948E
MVWGPGYGNAPPPSPSRGEDPFSAAERDTRAMVAAGWWPSAPPQQRQHAIGGRLLVLPDGTWWLFGAWARWYRLHPSDGQWYLCPPPHSPVVRMAARPAGQAGGQVPALPPHVVPAGPDFSYDPSPARPFVGRDFDSDLSMRVRATVDSAAALSVHEYPHWSGQFTPQTPSTVVAAWDVTLWCGAAPVFDSRLDAQMLDHWKQYRAKPLPDVDGPRWLTPPPLESLVALYAERLRASRVDAAVVVLRTMWAVASALREDARFQIRADALLAMLSSTLSNPTVDYGALPYGDQAIVQQWLTRCPPHLVPALRNESSPGDNFRHAFYSLSEEVARHIGDPNDPSYIEPRLVAAALLAADLAVVRKDVAANVVPWLDPEVRYTVQAVLHQNGHPLRHLWPDDMRLSRQLRSVSGERAETLLATMYELDLAWCKLAGGMPARPRGFPIPNAVVAGLIGRNRVRATAGAPTMTPPAQARPHQQAAPPPYGAQSQPGFPPDAHASAPQPIQTDRPFVQPPAQPGQQPAAFAASGPPMSGYAPSDEEQDENAAPPYTELGFQRPGGAAPGHAPAPGHTPAPASGYASPPAASPSPGVGPPAPVPSAGPPVPQGAAFGMPGTPSPPTPPTPPTPEQPPFGAPQPGPGLSPPEEEKPEGDVAPPYTLLGYQPAGAPQGPPVPMQQPPVPPAVQQPPLQQPPVDMHSTRMEDGSSGAPHGMGPPVPPAPPQERPRTRVLGQGDLEEAGAGQQPPPPPGKKAGGGGPGTRIMSETMVGNFDFLDDTPSPETPVEKIPPPSDRSERRSLERFGIGFVSGTRDAAQLLDAIRSQAERWEGPDTGNVDDTRVDGGAGPSTVLDGGAGPSTVLDGGAGPSTVLDGAPGMGAPGGGPGTRIDGGMTRVDGGRGGGPASGPPNVLIVGRPHSGQRRLARLIALTLADAGLGDGAIRAHDADDVRDAAAERLPGLLTRPGPALLFERLDVAITSAGDPAAAATAVRRARRSPAATAALIATCEPRAYKRLLRDHPRLIEPFQVYHLPDFSDLDRRMTLLHLLADERRVTIGTSALETARADLERLRGPGDLVNARLVEAYLDQACQRHLERAGGASRDRLVLVPDDLSGVAEGLEPALRPPGDIDGYLRSLDKLTGLEDVKQAVRELAEEAELAVDRARHGVGGGEPLHLVFTGPSGTGKTTVAGLLGGIYAALGLLDSGHVVACRPVHLSGRDQTDTETRVASMVEQALGGVLLIQEAYRMDRAPAVVNELLRCMRQRGGRLMVVCSSPAAEMEGFLAGAPQFGAEFGRTMDFEGMGDRDLVGLFQAYAERDLYILDEELRVELLARFARLRDDPRFAFARTVRALFEQTAARQAARLAGADVNAATVARLTARDLPESELEQMMGDFRQRG